MASLKTSSAYAAAGVDTSGVRGDLGRVTDILRDTFGHRENVVLDFGYFANILDIGGGIGIAIATDGVGTKLLVAEMTGVYDTVGIDCIAMNANDLLCVGATPTAMVDYVAVEQLDAEILEALARGLAEGARRACISIPGGEIAQVREMIRGVKPGRGLDLVGTCIGTVSLDAIIVGADVQPGDVVIGIESSGLHSNGYTLARRVLLDDAHLTLDGTPPKWEKPLGEVLLEPTHIYVPEIVAMFDAGLPVHALAHITGDGLTNLARVDAPVGFVIEWLPDPPAIMRLIQERGRVSSAEMYTVFNMGVGFCVALPESAADEALAFIEQHDKRAWRMGHVVADPARIVRLEPVGLMSAGTEFIPAT